MKKIRKILGEREECKHVTCNKKLRKYKYTKWYNEKKTCNKRKRLQVYDCNIKKVSTN